MATKSEASMDMKQHQATYQGFVHLTVLTVAFCISIVIMLALIHVGSPMLAGLGTFLALVGAVVGFVMNGSPWPIVAGTLLVLVLQMLFG